MRSVLVAFDGSPEAGSALGRASEIAQVQRARLVIVGVVTAPSLWLTYGALAMSITREDLERDREAELERAMTEARDQVPAGVSVTTRVVRGRPVGVLAELAAAATSELIVVGHRRRGRLRRSVARGLLSRTSASVLAVHDPSV